MVVAGWGWFLMQVPHNYTFPYIIIFAQAQMVSLKYFLFWVTSKKGWLKWADRATRSCYVSFLYKGISTSMSNSKLTRIYKHTTHKPAWKLHCNSGMDKQGLNTHTKNIFGIISFIINKHIWAGFIPPTIHWITQKANTVQNQPVHHFHRNWTQVIEYCSSHHKNSQSIQLSFTPCMWSAMHADIFLMY